MKKKLLLIDDEFDVTELAGAYLKLQGYDVESCNDSSAALGRLEQGQFDAVVVDLMMFPIDGMSIVRQLRALPAYARTPVFVLSAKAVTDDERKEMLLRRVHLLPKPFHPRGLAEAIRREVGNS